MKPRVYVETSVFSYLTARESASLIGATRQLLTRRWWERRKDYTLFVSEVVIRECKAGDQEAADHRIAAVGDIPLLSLTDQAAHIAKLLLYEGILPTKAAEDALHIAIAAVHKVDFLLSWNFKHIANPVIQAQIAAKLRGLGLSLPFICPPEDLAGEDDE
jgi:predicted nucleic acid-binding protein